VSIAPAVFLLQAKLREDDRVLVLDYECLVTLTGWLARPETNPRPDSLSAHWEGHPSGRRSEFPSFHLQAAIRTPSLGPMLSRSGTLIPLLADDDGAVEVGSYQRSTPTGCRTRRHSGSRRFPP
jgi:hypothetical protein